MRRQLISLIAAALLLCGLSISVFAHEVPDLSQPGTIEVTMQFAGEAIPGGSLTIYRVGDIVEENGNYSYQLTDTFAPSGVELTDVQSYYLALDLAEYAIEQDMEGITEKIDGEGHVIYAVEPGLYLFVQYLPAEGYQEVSPFLVGMPNVKDGKYIYDVDATPKVNPKPVPETTEPPETKPPQEQLPQTGQLNWPVPVLAVSGLALLIAGLALKGRKESDET